MSIQPILRPALDEGAHPRDLLAHVVETYGDRVCIATSLGPQTLVVLDLLHDLGARVPTFLLDTGFLFPETLALKAEIEARYRLEILAVQPGPGLDADLWRTDPEACCRLRKVEPLRRVLSGFDAWITGVRRDQADTRTAARAFEWDEQFGLVKINPLAHWTRAEVDDWLAARGVPVNPLLARGYRSVGCWPCTAPVAPGGGERDGRWPGSGRTECGIHRSPSRLGGS